MQSNFKLKSPNRDACEPLLADSTPKIDIIGSFKIKGAVSLDVSELTTQSGASTYQTRGII